MLFVFCFKEEEFPSSTVALKDCIAHVAERIIDMCAIC